MRNPVSCSAWLLVPVLLATALGGCDSGDESSPYGPTGAPLALVSHPLRITKVGSTWSQGFYPTGGTTPYSYYIDLASLPPGTQYQGDPLKVTIGGTPSVSGSYPFTIVVTDKAAETVSADFILNVVDEVSLSGTWLYTMTVTMVNGDCGESVGASRTHTVTITQSEDDLTVAGFFGDPAAQVTGSITLGNPFHDLTLSGSYPEDGGTTTGTHNLHIYSLVELAGTEHWAWVGDATSCYDSRASITAVRIGD